jgi:hypothetical protein
MKKTEMPIFGKSKKSAAIISLAAILFGTAAYAANTPQLNQAINSGSKSVDIVDGSGNTVASPSVSFESLTYSFDTQDGTGTLGTASEKIRAYNPTGAAVWSVNIAGSDATAVWTDGANTYDFNDASGYADGGDADLVGGQMTIDPSVGTLAGVSGCATTNVTKGASNSFVQESVDSIDLMSAASGAPTFCRWDLTGVGLTQKVPAGQVSGSYAVSMVLTIS